MHNDTNCTQAVSSGAPMPLRHSRSPMPWRHEGPQVSKTLKALKFYQVCL